ncbi:MAG: serine hydrolase domain-containing protein [Thermoanaerobaculia bacterium]|nr:serine hydrolase domain-containing protein [Thermoanaerobaculia bacterium]
MFAGALLFGLLLLPQPPPLVAQRAAADLLAFQAEKRIPGLSVAVGRDDRVFWSEAFGVTDLAAKTPVTRDSVFPLGSTSKVLTSLALGVLLDEGKIALDAPVQRWVPNFPVKPEGVITPRLLATHQAGLRDYDHAAGEYDNLRDFASVAAAVDVFRDDPLVFAPGTRHGYSAYHFVLLSAALEGAAGQDFLTLVRQRVTAPLGLEATGPNRRATPHPKLVTGYQPGMFGLPTPAPRLDVSNKWAAGGFVSTPTEMVRLGLAVLEEKVVSPRVLAELTTVQKLADGRDSGSIYALGWRAGTWKDSRGVEHRVFHHGGVANGGLSFFVLFPDARLAVSLLGNFRFEPFGDFAAAAYRVAEHFLPPTPARP